MTNKDEALKMVNQVLDDKHHYPDEDIPTLVLDALNACKEVLEQPAQVTRLEVIDSDGQSYVNWKVTKLELSYQDDVRTLKIFTNGVKE